MRAVSVLAAGLVAAAALATPALADQKAADACAAGLSADGKAIYAAALPGVAGGGDLRATVKSATIGLVQKGTIARGGAESAAKSAGRCLMKL